MLKTNGPYQDQSYTHERDFLLHMIKHFCFDQPVNINMILKSLVIKLIQQENKITPICTIYLLRKHINNAKYIIINEMKNKYTCMQFMSIPV